MRSGMHSVIMNMLRARRGLFPHTAAKTQSSVISTAVVEWFFQCDYEGNVDGFDGVTIAEFDADIKICDLKEFQSKVEHYCPYDS